MNLPDALLTHKQVRQLAWLKTELLARSGSPDRHEYKIWQVQPLGIGGIIVLLAEVGMIDDAGAIAAIFARDRRQISIGPNGGMRLLNTANGHKQRAGYHKLARGPSVVWARTTY